MNNQVRRSKTEWMSECAAIICSIGFEPRWAAAHAEVAWMEARSAHTSDSDVVDQISPSSAAKTAMEQMQLGSPDMDADRIIRPMGAEPDIVADLNTQVAPVAALTEIAGLLREQNALLRELVEAVCVTAPTNLGRAVESVTQSVERLGRRSNAP